MERKKTVKTEKEIEVTKANEVREVTEHHRRKGDRLRQIGSKQETGAPKRKGESETTEKNGTVNDPKTETETLPRTGTRTKNNNNNNNHRHRLTRSATRRKTKRERKGRMVTRKRQ